MRALTTAVLALSLLDLAHSQVLDRGLTPHFSKWLSDNGYSKYKFERTDLDGGAYGGKSGDEDQLGHNPVIFFHGNSDVAVGTNKWTW